MVSCIFVLFMSLYSICFLHVSLFHVILLHVSYYCSYKQAKEQIIKNKEKRARKGKINKIEEREREEESERGGERKLGRNKGRHSETSKNLPFLRGRVYQLKRKHKENK